MHFAGSLFLFCFESYMTAAWWCWWMGGVYSIRSFVDITAFMALPMGALFLWMEKVISEMDVKRRKAAIAIAVMFIGIFIYINLAFIRGAERGIINETMAGWWQLKQSLLLR